MYEVKVKRRSIHMDLNVFLMFVFSSYAVMFMFQPLRVK
jgi:hypothetical protein